MVFVVVFLNEGPLEKQHLLKGYPSQIYQIKYQIKNSKSDYSKIYIVLLVTYLLEHFLH